MCSDEIVTFNVMVRSWADLPLTLSVVMVGSESDVKGIKTGLGLILWIRCLKTFIVIF